MKVEIRFRGLEAENALREHTLRRIHYRLSRFGRELGTVVVRIGDVNGPKGGVDKRCHVTVRGKHFAVLSLDELSGDAYSAVDAAMERMGRVVGREVERTRASRRDDVDVRRAS